MKAKVIKNIDIPLNYKNYDAGGIIEIFENPKYKSFYQTYAKDNSIDSIPKDHIKLINL